MVAITLSWEALISSKKNYYTFAFSTTAFTIVCKTYKDVLFPVVLNPIAFYFTVS